MVQAKGGEGKSYETYKKVSTLGTGTFGTAYLVECQSDKKMAVIKQVDISGMSEEEKKETLFEAKVLEVLNHPNIVHFREVYKTKKGKLCIVMDYADGGDLQQKIKARFKEKNSQGIPNYMQENEILDIFTQIALALKHTHDKKILHRDLKSQNIFLTKRGIVKLGDFGIARVLSHTKSAAKTVVGTPYYLSPEIIRSEPYNFKSDIWSLGVLLYEMAALSPPFNAASLHQLAQRIIAGKYSSLPKHFTPAFNQLIKSMLIKDANQRPTVNQVLKHPLIEARIKNFLDGSIFKNEFSHTILHNQNVFEEFKKAQQMVKEDADTKLKAMQEAERKKAEEEAAAKKMAELNVGGYQPKYQNEQDAEYFAHAYRKYVDELSQEQTPATPQIGSRAMSYQDREENTDMDTKYSGGFGENNVDDKDAQEMINITSCDFVEFKAYMIKNYGQKAFDNGFDCIKVNRPMIYEENGEEKLIEMLKVYFPDADSTKRFLNFCTTFLIVQNMA